MSRNKKNTIRLTGGNGFRVVNLFTEEHAAFTGTRELVIEEELKPETSWNGNVNYVKKFLFKNDAFLSLDFTGFYTYFTNQILPDYDSDPNSIIYDNLEGYSVSQGVSLNTDLSLKNGLNINSGFTVMDVSFTEEGIKERQILSTPVDKRCLFSIHFIKRIINALKSKQNAKQDQQFLL